MDLSLIGDIVKVYGPLGIGWALAAYLIWDDRRRQDKRIEADMKIATTLEGFSQLLKERLPQR